MTKYRLHVWPWLRRIGELALSDWLAITIGNRILAWRALSDAELEHELAHVRQWSRFGVAFPLIYVAHSLRLRRAGKRWYHDNPFEKEARRVTERRSGGRKTT